MSEPANERILSIIRRAVVECATEELTPAEMSPATGRTRAIEEIFCSPEALVIKREIVDVGRKLWHRQYVDGNGGNISVRIAPEFVLCTPTLLSKADLTVEDIVMVDLANRHLSGARRQTSEILLHLEIYKAVPEARAVVHAHPVHATAFAVAGLTPQPNLIPEQEVFIGPVAVSAYDTPGTQAFAETVIPYVRNHNTVLLQNHGVVCWGDTATHAEWYIEVIDTYCKTVMLARQLKPTLEEIPPDKVLGLLAMKQRYGLPDARLAVSPVKTPPFACPAPAPQGAAGAAAGSSSPVSPELEGLIATIAAQVTRALKG